MRDLNPANNPALGSILTRAATDRAFRQRLLTEPREAVAEATGIRLPSSAKSSSWSETPSTT